MAEENAYLDGVVIKMCLKIDKGGFPRNLSFDDDDATRGIQVVDMIERGLC